MLGCLVRLILTGAAIATAGVVHGTQGGAQVLHEGDAVLATEVGELYTPHSRSKVDAVAFWVVAVFGFVQVLHQHAWDQLSGVRDYVLFNAPPAEFQEGWDGVGPVSDEPEHQWVVPEAQLLQVGELYQVLPGKDATN